MSEIGEAKANILGGKERVKSAREGASAAIESYAGANKELLLGFKALETVLEHLVRAEERYSAEINPRNAGVIMNLIDASSLFVGIEGEGRWQGDGLESPTYAADYQKDVFSDNEHTLQQGYTSLREILAVMAHAKETIQNDLLRQTDAAVPLSPAALTKDFAETTAPQIEAAAQEWHDRI